jgi:hypothetical protein
MDKNELASASGSRDCLIWTDDGVWLQTRGEDGVTRSSYCGQLDRLSVEFFAQTRGLGLHVHEPGRRSVAKGGFASNSHPGFME